MIIFSSGATSVMSGSSPQMRATGQTMVTAVNVEMASRRIKVTGKTLVSGANKMIQYTNRSYKWRLRTGKR